MLPSRDIVNQVLDQAFANGEAAVVLMSIEDVDDYATALISRVESLTGNDMGITLWGNDELPEKYTLRVAWIDQTKLARSCLAYNK